MQRNLCRPGKPIHRPTWTAPSPARVNAVAVARNEPLLALPVHQGRHASQTADRRHAVKLLSGTVIHRVQGRASCYDIFSPAPRERSNSEFVGIPVFPGSNPRGARQGMVRRHNGRRRSKGPIREERMGRTVLCVCFAVDVWTWISGERGRRIWCMLLHTVILTGVLASQYVPRIARRLDVQTC